MISIKPGVNLHGIRTEMLFAHSIVALLFAEYDCACVITSGIEGKHTSHSHHYKGLALDYRIRYLSVDLWDTFVRKLQHRLGNQYQVVLNRDVPVLHIEFDPEC